MNFLVQKRTLEKEEDNALFSKVYIFSRTNYNLPSAKTLSAMTQEGELLPTLYSRLCCLAHWRENLLRKHPGVLPSRRLNK